MDIEKLIHTLNDIRKRASADNAEVIACAIEIVKSKDPRGLWNLLFQCSRPTDTEKK